jgi:predicted nucleic acid-binding protein
VSDIYFDTNIVVDALHNRPQAWTELRRATRPWISRISWLEILAGAPDAAAAETEDFLRHFAISEIDEEISRRAGSIRQQRAAMTLADAIILASAQVTGRILVTRNTKVFPAAMPGIRIPYTL